MTYSPAPTITAMYEMHAVMSRALRLEFDDRSEPIVELAAPEGFAGFDVGAAIGDGGQIRFGPIYTYYKGTPTVALPIAAAASSAVVRRRFADE